MDRLKAAFTQGRPTEDELGARMSQALAARTYAELDALTAGLPANSSPAPLPASARRWRPARASAISAGRRFLAFVAGTPRPVRQPRLLEPARGQRCTGGRLVAR